MYMAHDTRTATTTQPKMWLVTNPTDDSELCDVLWECDWTDLGNAFKGGLDGATVVGLYYNYAQALAIATCILSARG